MTTNIIFTGVGGQGVILAGKVLMEVALRAGFDVKESEVHGMAQRGGSVECQVRFGEKVYSPLIPLGVHALRVFTLAFPIIGFPITGGHLFQAIGKPVPAALLALSRQVILFIPFILVFPLFWGLEGIFYAAPASDTLTFLISLGVVGRQLRRFSRLAPEPPAAP